MVHSIRLSWTDASWRQFLRTYEDILDREAVQPHKSKAILRMLGGASRIYGTHHVNSSPCDIQLITEFNDYIWALWTSRDITDQMLNSFCCCLTWRTQGLSPGSGKLIEKEKGVQLHLNLDTLFFVVIFRSSLTYQLFTRSLSSSPALKYPLVQDLDKHTEGYCSAKSMNFLIDLLQLPACCCASFFSSSICADSHSP